MMRLHRRSTSKPVCGAPGHMHACIVPPRKSQSVTLCMGQCLLQPQQQILHSSSLQVSRRRVLLECLFLYSIQLTIGGSTSCTVRTLSVCHRAKYPAVTNMNTSSQVCTLQLTSVRAGTHRFCDAGSNLSRLPGLVPVIQRVPTKPHQLLLAQLPGGRLHIYHHLPLHQKDAP